MLIGTGARTWHSGPFAQGTDNAQYSRCHPLRMWPL